MRWIFAALIFATVIFSYVLLYPLLKLGTAYTAKTVCSGIFVSELPLSMLRAQEIEPVHPSLSWIGTRIDIQNQKVNANFAGLVSSDAYFHPTHGCRLYKGFGDDNNIILSSTGGFTSLPSYTVEERGALGIDDPLLKQSIQSEFDKVANREHGAMRAIIVVYKGKILAEHYGDGIRRETPLKGWSMAKSLTGMLAGKILIAQNVKLNERVEFSDWQARSNDERGKILWSHLLRMTSGLAFDEDYTVPGSDATHLLFREPFAGEFAAQKPMAHPAGTHWSYSSGATNILAAALNQLLGGEAFALSQYAHSELLAPIGIHSAFLEVDRRGIFIGSSFAYMPAQDWARLGLLIAQRGEWQGNQIIPASWIDFMAIPAPHSGGEYGGHLWLNKGNASSRTHLPQLPSSALSFSGHDGQFILIIPEEELVIVRLAEDPDFSYQRDVGSLAASVRGAIGLTSEPDP